MHYYAFRRLSVLAVSNKGGQKAPLIFAPWTSIGRCFACGFQIGRCLLRLRGIYILTPRNMTQAVGFYNTMLQSNDTAVIVECLMDTDLKEKTRITLVNYSAISVPEY